MKLGVIGLGNMGSAILLGVLKKGLVKAVDVYVYDVDEKKRQAFSQCHITSNCRDLASQVDVLLLAIKPHIYPEVIDEIKHVIKADCLILDIAASVSLDNLNTYFGRQVQACRIMPNTPCLIGKGMSGIVLGQTCTHQQKEFVCEMFKSVGEIALIKENQINAVSSVCGASPAYIYMMIEAMAQGAIMQGISSEDAYRMASLACEGAACMVLETKQHPAKLRDAVCSPGGTTIEAVAKLEECGFKSAIIEAMRACEQKANNMAK